MIATLATLSRPTIVILESFDLFAQHARQALLYCLLDTAQSCHANNTASSSKSPGAGGLAVVGITSRNDCLNLLEKRVKSRFSGRSIRVGPPNTFEEYVAIARHFLDGPLLDVEAPRDTDSLEGFDDRLEEWAGVWSSAVEVRDEMRDMELYDGLTGLADLCDRQGGAPDIEGCLHHEAGRADDVPDSGNSAVTTPS